mgnify:CR=1 FL=1
MLDALKTNIQRIVAEIRPEVLEKVFENWKSRMAFVQNSRGGHLLTSQTKTTFA